MWKLTITQKKKTDYGVVDETVEFISDELSEVTMLIERFSHNHTVRETSYKIEKVGAENE